MCRGAHGTRRGRAWPKAVGSRAEAQLLCWSCRGHQRDVCEALGRGPGSASPGRAQATGAAGPPRRCLRGGDNGKGWDPVTKGWEADHQYFCNGHSGRSPAQSPPAQGQESRPAGSCRLAGGAEKGTVSTFSPTRRPGLQGATPGENKSISRWEGSKNQAKAPSSSASKSHQRKGQEQTVRPGDRQMGAPHCPLSTAPCTQPAADGRRTPPSGAGQPRGPCLALGPFPLAAWRLIPPPSQHHGHVAS